MIPPKTNVESNDFIEIYLQKYEWGVTGIWVTQSQLHHQKYTEEGWPRQKKEEKKRKIQPYSCSLRNFQAVIIFTKF